MDPAEIGLWKIPILMLVFNVYTFFYFLSVAVAGKSVGAKLLKFSVGCGPRLVGFRLGETDYCLSWIPWGCHVRFLGENPQELISPEDQGREFFQLSSTNKILIFTSGNSCVVFLSVLLLVVSGMLGRLEPGFIDQPARVGWCHPDSAFFHAGLARGDEIVSANTGGPTTEIRSWGKMLKVLVRATGTTLRLEVRRGKKTVLMKVRLKRSALSDLKHQIDPILEKFYPHSLAHMAGFKPGDRIVTIDDKKIKHWFDIHDALLFALARPGSAPGKQSALVTVQRASRSVTINTLLSGIEDKPIEGLGFIPPDRVIKRRHGLVGAATRAFQDLAEAINTTFRAFFRTGEYEPGFGTQRPRHQQYKSLVFYLFASGSSRLIVLIALFGLWLGMLNLLPIPTLPGGHILMEVLQMVLRRSIAQRSREIAAYVGIVLNLCLLVYIFAWVI